MSEGFIRAPTQLRHAPLVPEIKLHLATEMTPIWQASEAWLADHNMEPPFWAFAWPGGQALARYVFDNPTLIKAGMKILDFAAGCGIAGIACALLGADVEAAEIDRLAVAAIALNAAENKVFLTCLLADLVGAPGRWDMIICGDVCYEAPMTEHILPWLRDCARAGCIVWIADPGRAYRPATGLAEIHRCIVPTILELEDSGEREVVIYRLTGV